MEQRECKCYKNYIDALATINKLLVENYKDEVKESTFKEMHTAIETMRKECKTPFWEWADWMRDAVSVAEKPTRENLMKLRRKRAPYRYGQEEVESAFKRFHEDQPKKNVRESLLESIRITLHEPLQDEPLTKKPFIKELHEIGTQFSEGQWVLIGTRELKKRITESRAEMGEKKLPETEKGYRELLDEEKIEAYKKLKIHTCKI